MQCLCSSSALLLAPGVEEGSSWLDCIRFPGCQHRARAFPRPHRVESPSIFQERTLREMAKLS